MNEIVLGIDVGATGIKANLVDIKKGVVIRDRIKILTPKPATSESIGEIIKEMVQQFEWEGKLIGIGFPTILKNGVSYSATNLDDSWIGFNGQEYFTQLLSSEVYMVNDADAAGIAEQAFGELKGVMGTSILITLGTGIGSAVFYDKVLIPNTEFGHLLYKDGIFEQFASNRAREQSGAKWKAWANELRVYLEHLNFVFSPNRIVIGGGISKKFHKYEEHLNHVQTEIVPASMRNDAGIVGAAMFAWNKKSSFQKI